MGTLSPVTSVTSLTSVVSGETPYDVLAECFDEHDRLICRERLALSSNSPSFTIGRSLRADLVLNDAHAAELHATLTLRDDGVFTATDHGSVNGVVIGGKRHLNSAGRALQHNSITIGHTTIRLRSSLEELAPEKPDHRTTAGSLRGLTLATGILAATACLYVVYTNWIGAPTDLLQAVAADLGGLATAVALWVAAWALLTRILRQSWHWRLHALIVLSTSLAYALLSALLSLGLFAFSLEPWSFVEPGLMIIQIAATLYLHLRTASRLSNRSLLAVTVGLPVVLGTLTFWLSERASARSVNTVTAYNALFPPSLRLRQARSLDQFMTHARALESEAEAKKDRLPPSDNL